MTHRRTLLAILLAASALPAAPAGAADRVALRAVVADCDTERHTVSFQASMPGRRGAVRLQLRFTLLQRLEDDVRHERVAVPGWDQWETSQPGRSGFVFTKRVEGLEAPASYRALVRFRWLDARGRVQRKARRWTRACVQPDPRPNLRLVDTLWSDGRWQVVVENDGRATAPAFSVSGGVVGEPARSVRAEALPAGSRATVPVDAPCTQGEVLRFRVDSDGEVAEATEGDNVLERPCGA